MRAGTVNPTTLAVSLLAVLVFAVAAGCGASEEASSEASEAGAVAQAATDVDDKGAMEESAEEGNETVTATLTKIAGEKGSGGPREQVEVEYLPAGKKVATLETTKGVVRFELWEDQVPNTVINFVHLANSGRYDGVEFHRVIEGFMAQTGDVAHQGGYGGPGYSIPAEFNPELKHVRGVVSMARSQDPDSAGSQFFIMYVSHTGLDGQYAAFGKVFEGMDVIDALNKGEPPAEPDKIVKLRVASIAGE
ncbi:MAG: peptidylprolyl isomerase [Candidatus Eisenbacteria bacterium]